MEKTHIQSASCSGNIGGDEEFFGWFLFYCGLQCSVLVLISESVQL